MAQIIVIADQSTGDGEGAVMFRERVNLSDFESRHFARHLLERLGWAVEDAHELEREPEQEWEYADVAEHERADAPEHDPVGAPS